MSISTDVFMPLQSEIYGQTLRTQRKLANNTYGRIDGSDWYNYVITVRLHATDIVSVTPDRATYNTGGWFTVTTKERINRYLPHGWRLWSDRGVWQVGRYRYNSDTGGSEYVDKSLFYDGISFVDDDEGNAIVADSRPVVDNNKALRKAINDYARLYTSDRVAEMLAEGGAGDCWYCSMRDENGRTMGEIGNDTDHLTEHIEESYTMLNLAYNALSWAGYRDPVLLLQIRAGDTVSRAVRRYLVRKLVKQ